MSPESILQLQVCPVTWIQIKAELVNASKQVGANYWRLLFLFKEHSAVGRQIKVSERCEDVTGVMKENRSTQLSVHG